MANKSLQKGVAELVERFDRNIEAYKSGSYNEAQVRQEFINPLFKLLGWDIHNEQGNAEAYKDVVHEDAIKIGGATRAPDYCFRAGGARKFFLEAKKPSVNIKEEVSPAFQLRRYAWSAKLPLSILTDFEEFAVYDCRVKPASTDKVSTARILYFRYTEYLDRWDEIASVFSRDAVYKGFFDKYAESTKAKKGTAEVDASFLKEIETWRESLARNLALRNPALAQRELNFAVQRIIDRIIFLRICEDRGIETYGRLMALQNGTEVYQRLCRLFRDADDRYNSGLFHFYKEKGRPTPPDELTLNLKIDDKLLKDIFKGFYYPDSPYEFSVLSADILGQVYEQFLGKVIRLTSGHRAAIEDKPEVKKAGGVYYTPTCIVDYIVKQTVGKLLEGKKPGPRGGVSKIKVLDPACGSGSFLIGAYQYLLDWHRDKYIENGPKKHKKELFQAQGGEWRLTTAERKRILLNNIYGVDIDSQAVETTKLSLLLKVLEGESGETLKRQLKLFHERALPDLGSNIKCGNSLIGPDFYDNSQMGLFDDEERYRINVFDWKAEFPEIIKAGGFDAVIGNPPYGIPFAKIDLDYLSSHFSQTNKFPDSYCLFISAAMKLIANKKSYVSFIVPNTFCDLESCDIFRKWFLCENNLQSIWQSGWAFKAAVVDTLVFIASKGRPPEGNKVSIMVNDRNFNRTISSFNSNYLYKIDYRLAEVDKYILNKISKNAVQLKSVAIVKAGVKLYEKGKGTPPQTKETLQSRPFTTKEQCPDGWKPLYRGLNIDRYFINTSKEFVNYGPWLAAPRSENIFKGKKILMRRTDDRLLSCLEKESAICVNSCHVIFFRESVEPLSYSYLLGLLNSTLLQHIFELQNPQMVGKVFAEIKVVYVERLLIRTIDFSNAKDKSRHDKMVKLVERMLELNKQLSKAKIAHDKTVLQRQIEATDRQIDELVYELYGLTKKEITIVEEAGK